MLKIIRKIFGFIPAFFKWIRYWIDYWELKPGKEVVGLLIALCCAAVLFFLPSYDPPYNMTTEKFTKLCENNGFEMQDIIDKYFYMQSAAEDTHEDYTLKYLSCTDECYTKFFCAREIVSQRKAGGRETNVYNPQFQLTTFTSLDRQTTVYRNGTELLIVSGPKSDLSTLNAILKKCRIPKV